jgi:peptidoglycan/LPS O-acetylase OafA/YrhL
LAGRSTIPAKSHYAALDGLRGVAALAVVLFHFMERVIGDYAISSSDTVGLPSISFSVSPGLSLATITTIALCRCHIGI